MGWAVAILGKSGRSWQGELPPRALPRGVLCRLAAAQCDREGATQPGPHIPSQQPPHQSHPRAGTPPPFPSSQWGDELHI